MIDKQLFKLIGNNKKYIFLTVGLMIISSLANILITASICYAIYLTISNTSIFNYIYPAITTIICILIRYITTNKVGYIRNMIGEKIKKDLREKTYNKILKLGEKETKDMSLAGLTQVSMEGIEQLDLYYSMYLPQFFFSLISPVILFLICVGIDWRVACVLLLCVPLIPLSIVMVSKYAKRIFNKYWGKYTSMGDSFLDSIQGLKELKIFEADEKQHEYINKSAEEFRKITMKVLVMQLVSITIMDLVAFTGAAIGIAFALNSAINHTNPILALFLILVAVEFFLPLRALGSAFHIAMNGASAGKKIITILNLEVPKWGKEKVENTNIELKDIEFSYDGHRKVLNNINMKFNNIGMHAIVGKSGCGKSTIVGLIVGANKAQKGNILIGKKLIESISRDDYYSNIAVVSYNTYIFNTSIRENFYLAKSAATDEEIYEALKKVNLYDFIVENGGLDKVITEDANNISGGQRQRLALAINLIANKNIYIFDEATSNIDIESEAIIMKNIKEISKTKSVIIISHRLENVIDADEIFYMENGKITEQGTHEQLMNQNAHYEKLYKAQKNLEEGYKEVTYEY